MSKKFDYSTLWNWNGHLLCAIDIFTNGPDMKLHDLIEISILPLDSEIKPIGSGMIPFSPILRPKRSDKYLDSLQPNLRTKTAEAMVIGIDPYDAADLLDKWFEDLGLASNKRIIPLAYNWPAIRPYIVDWITQKNFDAIFDYRYRDILTATLFCNDRADMKVEQIPYPKVDLQYLASQSKIERRSQWDTIADCAIIAEIYRRCLMGAI
jgi:hypothetical protein